MAAISKVDASTIGSDDEADDEELSSSADELSNCSLELLDEDESCSIDESNHFPDEEYDCTTMVLACGSLA